VRNPRQNVGKQGGAFWAAALLFFAVWGAGATNAQGADASPTNAQEAKSQLDALRAELRALERKAKSVAERRAEIERRLQIAETSAVILARRLARLEAEAQRLEQQVTAAKQAWEAAQARAQESRQRLAHLAEALSLTLPLDPVLGGGPQVISVVAEGVREQAAAQVQRWIAQAETERAQAAKMAQALAQKQAALSAQQAELAKERARWEQLAEKRKVLHEALAETLANVEDRRKALEADARALSQLVKRLEAEAKRRAQEEARRRKTEAKRGKIPEGDRATARAMVAQRGALPSPVAQGTLTATFGERRPEGGTWHGLFWSAPEGASVHAIADGVVAFADWLRGYGQLVILDHGQGLLTIYANLDAPLVAVGETVRKGETIGRVGRTEHFATSGLYFELRKGGKPVDPRPWLKQ
jgi:septal ring factor EnvC (AmiA/AmiB activator)